MDTFAKRALRRYADWQALERATVDGRLVTADPLWIRQCDVDHLIHPSD